MHVRLAGLLCLILMIVACTPEHDNSLRFGLQSAPLTLDPRFASDAASARINRLIYRRLVDFDASARPIPGLASWQVISPTHYRFTLLDKDRVFHDGTRLNAEDVVATYRSLLDPAAASPHRTSLALIERVEALDEDRIDFHLARADALFPSYLVIGIAPARRIAEGRSLGQKPLGSGAFRFLAWPEEGRVQLQRVSDGQRLEFVRVADPTVRIMKLLRGEIDMLQNDLPPELVNYLSAQPGIHLQRAAGGNFTYLGFNLQDADTGKPELRKAIAHAIDRQAIIRYVLGDAARPAQALLPPTHWAGHPNLPGYAYDPDRARALLADLGIDRHHRLTLSYKTSSDPLRLRIVSVIQQQLAEVGIDIDIRSYDWGTFYGDIKAGRFQLYSLSWVGIKTPDIFRYAFHSQSLPPEGANRGRYANTLTDQLIESAEAANDPLEQARGYRAVQAQLARDLPYVPLWYEDHVFVSRADISGYDIAPDGAYDGLIGTLRIDPRVGRQPGCCKVYAVTGHCHRRSGEPGPLTALPATECPRT